MVRDRAGPVHHGERVVPDGDAAEALVKIGWIGLGKLGMPCAEALAKAGHQVIGYDLHPVVWHGFQVVDDLVHAVVDRDIVFVAVQTPHPPEYDGSTPVPNERRDFEYKYLIQAIYDIARLTHDRDRPLT